MKSSGITSAKPKTMRKTLQHINDKYGSVDEYIRLTGLSDGEIDALRHCLCKPGKIAQHSTNVDLDGHSKGPEYGKDQDQL